MGPLALGPLRSENVGESVSPPIFAVGKPRTQRLRRRAFSSVGASSNGLLSGHFPSDPPPSSAGEAIVAGTLDWSDTLPGWIGKLPMRWQGVDCTWGIGSVNYDAAFRNIVRGVVLVTSGVARRDQGN